METWDGYLFYIVTALFWLAAVLAVVIALRKSAPRASLVLMGVGAAIFAVGHPQPTGPIGMAFFLAGVVWLELRPRRAESPERPVAFPTQVDTLSARETVRT